MRACRIRQARANNNAYFSYAWATARRLHAAVHLVAQGGIALRDGTGYYENGTRGMESC